MKVRDLVGLDSIIRADEQERPALLPPSVSGGGLLPSVIVSPPVRSVGVASSAVRSTPSNVIIGQASVTPDGLLRIEWRNGFITVLPGLLGPLD